MGVVAVWQYTGYSAAHPGKPFEKVLYTWMGTGDTSVTYPMHGGRTAEFRADAGFLLDPLSCIWLLFVTGVGMLIHIYSIGYMGHEGGYYRFFGYMNLFMFSMLTLILANNYAVMFVGWEGVGLCSYLLIGFYFQRHSASTAANKAFIVNRIGDAGFILGMFTIAWYFGSMQYTKVNLLARSGQFHIGDPVITAACLLLFVGACGKSAQFPLYVWLPDAMEGPTPVSALIHAATMVTAGVYMVARSNALFVLAPNAMKTVAIVGALTAIFAATIALVQNDIKRVLAYSTVSQLGYMFLALGVGAFAAGVFHVFTHAFFKALLFLGAGSVIHAMSGQQEMQHMGALHGKIKTTFGTMLIATLAIAGIPGFAGFFSKDAILWETWSREAGAYRYLWYIAFLTALMTSFYMFRLIYLTFFGKPRMNHEVEHHIHESPKTMTVPLVILAICSIGAGFLGMPHSLGGSNRFERFLEPVFAKEATVLQESGKAAQVAAGEQQVEHTDPMEYILMFASVGAAVVGWFLAQRAYKKADKGYKSRSRSSRHVSTRRCSASGTWMKSTTGSSPAARRWGQCVWARWVWARAVEVRRRRYRRHRERSRLDNTDDRQPIRAVGQVDHRWPLCEWSRYLDAAGLVSNSPNAVGPGAVVRAGNGGRAGRASFFITLSGGEVPTLSPKEDERMGRPVVSLVRFDRRFFEMASCFN